MSDHHKEHKSSMIAEILEKIETTGILISHIIGTAKYIPVAGAVLTGCSLLAQVAGITLRSRSEKVESTEKMQVIQKLSALIMGTTLTIALLAPGAALGAAAVIIMASALIGGFVGSITQLVKTYKTIKKSQKIENPQARRRAQVRCLTKNSARLIAEVLMLIIHIKIAFEIMGFEAALGGNLGMIGLAIAGLSLIAVSMMIKVKIADHIKTDIATVKQDITSLYHQACNQMQAIETKLGKDPKADISRLAKDLSKTTVELEKTEEHISESDCVHRLYQYINESPHNNKIMSELSNDAKNILQKHQQPHVGDLKIIQPLEQQKSESAHIIDSQSKPSSEFKVRAG